jgi:hypothetical protein
VHVILLLPWPVLSVGTFCWLILSRASTLGLLWWCHRRLGVGFKYVVAGCVLDGGCTYSEGSCGTLLFTISGLL